MVTQFDEKIRVVSIPNLKAMLERISGHCHRYWIQKQSKNRIYIAYSNPDEYGNESPMIAIYPIVPMYGTEGVLLEMCDFQHDNWHGEGWQAFMPLFDCEKLYRCSDEHKFVKIEWRSDKELREIYGKEKNNQSISQETPS